MKYTETNIKNKKIEKMEIKRKKIEKKTERKERRAVKEWQNWYKKVTKERKGMKERSQFFPSNKQLVTPENNNTIEIQGGWNICRHVNGNESKKTKIIQSTWVSSFEYNLLSC